MIGLWSVLLMMFLPAPAADDALLNALKSEVDREFAVLKDGTPPVYDLAYRAEDRESLSLEATLGKLSGAYPRHIRQVDVLLRAGTPALDNSHELKGRDSFDYSEYYSAPELLPLEDDAGVIRRELWRLTQLKLGKAVERFQKVTANETVMAQAEDRSPDYTMIPPAQDVRPKHALAVDRSRWTGTLERVSRVFRDYPQIYSSSASLQAQGVTNYYVSASGTLLRHPSVHIRVYISASTRSADGMPLFLHESFGGFAEKDMPSEKELVQTAKALAEKLGRLRQAPAVDPYLGPAIFLPKAAGVFFHEVMGHRLEGHRQKSEKEGQTFTKKVGQPVLPAFMSLVDDPTLDVFKGRPLLGRYAYDDEGAPAQKALLVDKGTLKGFLMNRSPITGFAETNGHGRGNIGRKSVARQGNLMALPDSSVPFPRLRAMLVEEIKKQNKPYGLLFADISGGFTVTERGFLQAFKVVPLEVYRIWPDGRPDELVRGADIVGTPLAALEKIQAASDDFDVFNGFCGAESGFIPVAAVSPSILVEEIEVEKKEKDMERPPVLPSPLEGGVR
jgi:predicted Zn-dependent protease